MRAIMRAAVRKISWAITAVLLLPVLPAHAAKDTRDQPDVMVRIPVTPMGYPVRRSRVMPGSAMYTLNYVDSSHLLFTFTRHELLRRIPNDPPDDEDRNVTAVLLDLPSGKVLARTDWRMHDYGQYLWDLGNGRFLLRRRNDLVTFAPLASPADPFAEQPLLKVDDAHAISDIGISSDRGVLVLEISPKPPSTDTAQPSPAPRMPGVAVQFIRLLPAKSPADPLPFRLDTAVQRQNPTEFSLTSAGFMLVKQEAAYRWGFDFRQYDGKVKQLAGLESTCAPFPVFVSGSEFVSFGCRGSDYKASLTGFNMAGDISWQMTFSEPQAYSSLSTAPLAGRFAISRSLAGGFVAPNSPSQIIQQEVRVIQSYNGKVLLRADCSPVQATGQNFSIAPDGLSVAIMQDDIVVYRLPELTDEDLKQVLAARQMEPHLPLSTKVDLRGGPPELPRQPASATATPGATAAPPPPPPPPLLKGDDTDDSSPLQQRKPSIFLPQ